MNRYLVARIKPDMFVPDRYDVFVALPNGCFARSSTLTDNEIGGLRSLHLIEQVIGPQKRMVKDGVIAEYAVADAVIDENPFFKNMFNRRGK